MVSSCAGIGMAGAGAGLGSSTGVVGVIGRAALRSREFGSVATLTTSILAIGLSTVGAVCVLGVGLSSLTKLIVGGACLTVVD